MTWVKLAWANRARIIAAAKALHWSRREWMRLGALAAVGVGVYLAATHGYLDRWNPTGWSGAQWAQLVVNLTGFGILYVAMRSWWGRQDEVWDEVDKLRRELDELREFVHEPAPDTINALPSARPAPPPPAPERARTAVFQSVRSAPIEGEPATVQRELGGRTFSFRESSDVG